MSAATLLRRYKQSGIGLVEVLITMAILVTGVTALTKLQTQIIKDNRYSQERSSALALAQRKLEDLHSFTTITAPINAPDWKADLKTEMAYHYIDTDKGGKIPSGVVNESLHHSTVFTLHWYVVDHASGLALTSETLTTSTLRKVTVVVSWTDATGANNSVALTDVLAAILPDNGAFALKNSSTDVIYPQPAKVMSSQLPAIADVKTTPLKISDAATKRETTWQEFKEDGRRYKLSATGCECTQSATTDQAQVASFQDGGGFDVGAWVVKRVGINNGSDINCNVCCKHHHDTVYTTIVPSTKYSYSAFRIQAGYRGSAVNKDHSHYHSEGTYSNTNQSSRYTPNVTYTLADAAGNVYSEACFLQKINGFVTALSDLRQIDLNVFPEAFLNTAPNQTLYSDYVKILLEQYILAIDSTAISSSTRLYASPDVSNDTTVNSARIRMNIPSTVTTPSSTPLTARVIAVSYMKPWMIAILRCKINGSTLTYVSGSAISDDHGDVIKCANYPIDSQWLKFVPFHEMDVTDYVEWLVSNSDPSWGASVMSAGVDTRGNSMGVVTLGLADSASVDVTARMRRSNSAYLGPDYFVNSYDDLNRLVSNNTMRVTKSVP